MLSLTHFLVLGAILFSISMAGIFINRKNVILLLMCVELMLLAVNTNFIAFSHFLGDSAGQVFVFSAGCNSINVFHLFPNLYLESVNGPQWAVNSSCCWPNIGANGTNSRIAVIPKIAVWHRQTIAEIHLPDW